MSRNHITYEERVKIEAYRANGQTNGEIANLLDRHRSTIGRELKRNGRRYAAKTAEKRRLTLRKKVNQHLHKIIAGSSLARYIDDGLRKYWSPEQIMGRYRKDHPRSVSVCHETIYRYIYEEKPELKTFLRCRQGRYRRRYGMKKMDIRREEAKKKRIDKRPAIVEARSRLGDLEGDTIVGAEKTVHALTHVDRKSGRLYLDKVDHATAEEVHKITVQRLKHIPKKKRHTITYDNGVQFQEHEATARDLDVDIYFAFPYHSWERGSNENVNGLVRQFLPKGTPFKDVSRRQFHHIETLINSRPRKRHGYLTPLEI